MKKRNPKTLEILNIKDVKHLLHHCKCSLDEIIDISNNPSQYYRTKYKKKPNGKFRRIDEPSPRLKQIQRNLNALFSRLYLPESLQGSIKGKSNFTNARFHIDKDAVINIDIENFFPSISNRMVFNLFNTNLNCSPEVAHYLTKLTTYCGAIPQGTPTSSTIANLISYHSGLVDYFTEIAKEFGADYSQYMDDITLSGDKKLAGFRKKLERGVRRFGFKPNLDKTKIMLSGKPQFVTGLKVNCQLDLSASYYKTNLQLIRDMGDLDDKAMITAIKKISGRINYIKSVNFGAAKIHRRFLVREINKRDPTLIKWITC